MSENLFFSKKDGKLFTVLSDFLTEKPAEEYVNDLARRIKSFKALWEYENRAVGIAFVEESNSYRPGTPVLYMETEIKDNPVVGATEITGRTMEEWLSR